jgi:hypothetical protein
LSAPRPRIEGTRWVDLGEVDHRGYFYGIARSPSYIPLYGNDFEALDAALSFLFEGRLVVKASGGR